MIHLTIQQLSSHFDGELSDSSAALVRQHFTSCRECARKYAQLEAQGNALAEALAIDPDDAFFQRLALDIEERIDPNRAKAPPPRAAAAGGAPRVAGSTTVADVGEAPPRAARAALPAPPGRGTIRRSPSRRPRPAAPWIAAALVGVLAVSVGVLVSGAGRQAWRLAVDGIAARGSSPSEPAAVEPPAAPPAAGPAVAPPRSAPEPSAEADAGTPSEEQPENSAELEEISGDTPSGGSREGAPSAGEPDFVPVPIRADDALATPPAARARPAGDPFGLLDAKARSAVRSAQRLSDAAANDLSAEGFDGAAAEWERTLPLLRGDAYRTARLRLAEARYHAWQLTPNEEHAAGAEAALRGYLVAAPAGTDRENAAAWLSRLEEAGFR